MMADNYTSEDDVQSADERYGKTVQDCNHYMLNNNVETDISFKVGPPNGPKVKFRAHKFPLISRSPVFEEMIVPARPYKKKRKSKNKFRIEDIDAEVFKQLLNYIYCDKATITGENAISLWHAAEKYQLKGLTKNCIEWMENSAPFDNVCTLLSFSISFRHKDLKRICLDLMSMRSKEALKSDGFLSLSREALDTVLSLESMSVNEYFVYKACMNWAKHRLRTVDSIDNPTAEDIKDTLGDLRFKIRVSSMKEEEHEILIKENIVCCSGNRIDTRKRKLIKECCYEVALKPYSEMIYGQVEDTFDFRVRHQSSYCLMTGLGLYSAARKDDFHAKRHELQRKYLDEGDYVYEDYIKRLLTAAKSDNYEVKVEIHEVVESEYGTRGKKLFEESFVVPYTGSSEPYRVTFNRAVPVPSGDYYSIQINLLKGAMAYASKTISKTSLECRNNEDFVPDWEDKSGRRRLIPEIYYVKRR